MIWKTRPRSEKSGLSAIIAGRGHQALMLHGVGLRSEAWNSQIDFLSNAFRVTAIDLPGHGQSQNPRPFMKLSDYTDLVAQVMEEPALVIGHSMGAMIALDIASRFPERVTGVVALNAIFERDGKASSAVKARAAGLDGKNASDPEPTLQRWFADRPSPERDACRTWLEEVDPASYKTAYTAFAGHDGPQRDALAAMAVPALFVTGAEEPNSTPAMSKAMAEIVPRGEVVIVEGAAHMMPMTHADILNPRLSAFGMKVIS